MLLNDRRPRPRPRRGRRSQPGLSLTLSSGDIGALPFDHWSLLFGPAGVEAPAGGGAANHRAPTRRHGTRIKPFADRCGWRCLPRTMRHPFEAKSSTHIRAIRALASCGEPIGRKVNSARSFYGSAPLLARCTEWPNGPIRNINRRLTPRLSDSVRPVYREPSGGKRGRNDGSAQAAEP